MIFDKLNMGVAKLYQGGVPGINVNPIKERIEIIIPTIKEGLTSLM